MGLPVWRRSLHLLPASVSRGQLATLGSGKSQIQWRGLRNALGGGGFLLRGITMIHLHKSAKLVIIALANPATLWASKDDERRGGSSTPPPPPSPGGRVNLVERGQVCVCVFARHPCLLAALKHIQSEVNSKAAKLEMKQKCKTSSGRNQNKCAGSESPWKPSFCRVYVRCVRFGVWNC